jgi:hypothetical protein
MEAASFMEPADKRYSVQPDQVVRRNDEAISEARQDLTKTSFKTSNDFGLLNHRDGNCSNQLKSLMQLSFDNMKDF